MTASLRIYQDVEDDNMSMILPLKIKFDKESTTPALLWRGHDYVLYFITIFFYHNQVYGTKDGEYYCESCYLDMEALHCATCGKVIQKIGRISSQKNPFISNNIS